MKHFCTILFLSILCSTSALSIDAWQNIRFSGIGADSKVNMRTEINQNNITQNKILYQNGTGISETDLTLFNATTRSYQAQVNAGTGRVYYGLRKSIGSELPEILPVRYSGTGLPAPALLTKVSDSPVDNDIPNHCDIISDYVTLTDTKLIVGLKTRGGGFPTSGGFLGPFYSYMVGVADPALDDPYAPGAVAWALHYVNISLLSYTAGLYKITGTSTSDITRIASIQSSIDTATNTLVMSCDLSVLLSDPDFQAFYNPDNPRVGFLSLINKMALSGLTPVVTQMDYSSGARINLSPLYVDYDQPLYTLNSLQMNNSASNMHFEAVLNKPENRYILGMSLHSTDGRNFNMTSIDPETATTRIYRTSNLKVSFPEGDNQGLKARTEVATGVYEESPYYYFNYVRKLSDPEQLDIQVVDDMLLLDWDAVTHSFAGAPITVDYYIIEYSDVPNGTYQTLGQSPTNSFSLPLDTLENTGFFRIKAVKNVP